MSETLIQELLRKSRELRLKQTLGSKSSPQSPPANSSAHGPSRLDGSGNSTSETIPSDEFTVSSDDRTYTPQVPRGGQQAGDDIEAVLNSRYKSLAELGSGGMGLVLRVKDKLLNRELAMKIIHQSFMENEVNAARFIHEAQVSAQLQHPNILPIHDLGLLDDGRIFITMTEIRGGSFDQYIQGVHDASPKGVWNASEDNWNMHRLISAFQDVCKAVSYAHQRGVVHRDLKPSNIMIGPYGEVLLVDWGVAKILGQPETRKRVRTLTSDSDTDLTRHGGICGTPSYLAPELVSNENQAANEKTDLYALGVTLFEILRGHRPFRANGYADLIYRIGCQEPESFYSLPGFDHLALASPVSANGAVLPEVLVQICIKAMAKSPEDRFNSVGEMVQLLGSWLDGSKRREKALELVDEAKQYSSDIERLKTEADEILSQAVAMQKGTETWEPEESKQDVWFLEDKSRGLVGEALMRRTQQVQLYRSALAHKADLPEAHSALASHYRELHEQAESLGDVDTAYEAEIILREHVEALSDTHPEKLDYSTYLSGEGKLSLDTVPSEARLSLYSFEKKNRRLVLGAQAVLGSSPIIDKSILTGSYIVKIELQGYHDAFCPVFNRRLDNTDNLHPNGKKVPIVLLPMGTLKENDCYVPAGWCWLGGDKKTPNSLPRQRVWIDGFVMRRFPVTHKEYIAFLNFLIERGEREKADLHAPREQSSSEEERGQLVYLRDSKGLFKLPEDPKRAICWPDQPVTMIQWRSARAYAQWVAQLTNKPWRLPMEFEWEKAARGVDARFYPWGNDFDPSWACMKDSHQEEVKMQLVDSFPHDVSIYGVRGTAGNTRDWCLDRYREEGPIMKDGLLVMPSDEDLKDNGFKSTRGGSYGNSASRSRSADRDWWFPERSYVGRGFRLVWGINDLF